MSCYQENNCNTFMSADQCFLSACSTNWSSKTTVVLYSAIVTWFFVRWNVDGLLLFPCCADCCPFRRLVLHHPTKGEWLGYESFCYLFSPEGFYSTAEEVRALSLKQGANLDGKNVIVTGRNVSITLILIADRRTWRNRPWNRQTVGQMEHQHLGSRKKLFLRSLRRSNQWS